MKTWICGKNRSKGTASGQTPTTPPEHPDLPSVAAVLTVSAPNMLMSASLNCLLVGFGVYLGFTWTENLDAEAGKYGSRAVFCTYNAGLIFCYGVYSISSAIVASDSHVSEHELLYGNDDANTQQHISGDEESTAGASNQPETTICNTHDEDTRKELLVLFQEAADMRKASAKVDERLARLLERFGEETAVCLPIRV